MQIINEELGLIEDSGNPWPALPGDSALAAAVKVMVNAGVDKNHVTAVFKANEKDFIEAMAHYYQDRHYRIREE